MLLFLKSVMESMKEINKKTGSIQTVMAGLGQILKSVPWKKIAMTQTFPVVFLSHIQYWRRVDGTHQGGFALPWWDDGKNPWEELQVLCPALQQAAVVSLWHFRVSLLLAYTSLICNKLYVISQFIFPFARALTWFYNLPHCDINNMDENPSMSQKNASTEYP